jgi:uncharacterized membrane protein YfcA
MVVRMIVQTFVWYGVIGLMLFLAAGTVDWPAAWIFLAVMIVLSLVGGLWLVRHDPALVQQRLAPPIQRDQPTADKILLTVIILVIFGARSSSWLSMPSGLDGRLFRPGCRRSAG